MEKNAYKKLLYALLLLGFLVYGLVFIYRTSFIVEGKRYFCLFDDAMVSMTYARNLARGNGLVWHPDGEKVEGCTNLLWVVFMSGFHLLPLDESRISLCIQLCGLLILAINLVFVKKISDLLWGDWWCSWGAVLLTAFYLPLVNWSLQGMEVSALTLLVTLSVWSALKAQTRNTLPFLPFFLIGIGTLIRLDMVVPSLGLLLFFLWDNPHHRTRVKIGGVLVLILCLLGQTLFRIAYYGDILPNPYYLKMTGIPLSMRLFRGMIVLCLFVWKMNWVLFFLPFVMLLATGNRKTRLAAVLVFLQMGYSVFAGGDSWEWWGGSNRFISIVMPLFFILFSGSLREICEILKIPITSRIFQRAGIRTVLYLAVLLASLVNFNAIRGPSALKEWLLLERPLHVEDHREKVEEALLLKRITRPDARVAVAWSGIPIYFSGRRGVDLLGKNDRKIAREPMRKIDSFHKFNPGHLKRDYAYSIGELKPDVVAELAREPDEATPFLDESYQAFRTDKFLMYLLKNSRNIDWEEAKRMEGK